MSFDSPAGRGATYTGGFGCNWVLIELWLEQTETVVFMEGCIIFSFLCGCYKTCYSFDPDCPFWWGWRRRKRCVGFSKGSQMVSSTGQYEVMRSIKLNSYRISLCCRGLSRFFFCRPIFLKFSLFVRNCQSQSTDLAAMVPYCTALIRVCVCEMRRNIISKSCNWKNFYGRPTLNYHSVAWIRITLFFVSLYVTEAVITGSGKHLSHNRLKSNFLQVIGFCNGAIAMQWDNVTIVMHCSSRVLKCLLSDVLFWLS